MPEHGPARVLLGSYGSASSAIASPSPINYLAVRLHELVLGYYSVHTSPEALRRGEAHILSIRERLVQEGRL